MKEVFKPVKGYEGLYEVSNLGNVRSVARTVIAYNGEKRRFNNRILKWNASKKTKKHPIQRYAVELWKDNKRKRVFVHRLVGMNFIPNPNNLPQINHKDGNPKNNSIDNLEWVDNSTNVKHAYATGLNKGFTKKIIGIHPATGKRTSFASCADAARKLNGNPDAIRGCLKGRSRTSAGMMWEYDNE